MQVPEVFLMNQLHNRLLGCQPLAQMVLKVVMQHNKKNSIALFNKQAGLIHPPTWPILGNFLELCQDIPEEPRLHPRVPLYSDLKKSCFEALWANFYTHYICKSMKCINILTFKNNVMV